MEQITEGLMILILGTIDLKTHSKNTKFSTYCTSLIDWLFELIYIISICTFFFNSVMNSTVLQQMKIQLEKSLTAVKRTDIHGQKTFPTYSKVHWPAKYLIMESQWQMWNVSKNH